MVSLFLEDWEFVWVALSGHMALGLSCQGMQDACKESSMSQCSLCSQCLDDSLTLEGL